MSKGIKMVDVNNGKIIFRTEKIEDEIRETYFVRANQFDSVVQNKFGTNFSGYIRLGYIQGNPSVRDENEQQTLRCVKILSSTNGSVVEYDNCADNRYLCFDLSESVFDLVKQGGVFYS